jgi:hypothetical protein
MSLPAPYSRKTLLANWVEDRQKPGDVERDFRELRFLRPYETDVANLEQKFSVLERIARTPNHNSWGTIADYGDRETECSNKVDFAHPDSRKEFVKKSASVPTFITSETVPECDADGNRRPVPAVRKSSVPLTGYTATLQRHPKDEGKRYFASGSRDAFGYPAPTKCTDRSKLRAAGVGVLDVADRAEGLQVGVLAGEQYRPDADPAYNTLVQRSWLYEPDASLRNVAKYGGRKPKPSLIDNHMSIPLGEGGHRAMDTQLKNRGGRLPRVSTSITTGKEKKFGINIFQDD